MSCSFRWDGKVRFIYLYYLYTQFIYFRDAKHRKHKRAIEEGEDNEVKLNATLGELQFIEAEFDGVIGSWQKLVPSVVGCYASVAGKVMIKCEVCLSYSLFI